MRAKASRWGALFRAEWMASGKRERATATALTSSSIFVATENLPSVGEQLQLFLSFGRRASFGTAVRVTNVHLTVEPGNPAGFAATFEDDDATRAAVAALLELTQAPSGGRRDIRVLHAEKSRLLRDMFGYTVGKYFATRGPAPTLVQVEDLEGAKSALERGTIDVAVIDQNLHDGAGHELVRRVRERAGRRCWIVGVGVETGAARARMLDAGADIYLQKPIALTDLLLSIELVTHQSMRDTAGAA